MSSDTLHLVCPHCHTTNRLAVHQVGQSPDCGKCHRPLFMGQSVPLDATTFDKHLSRNDVPVLVDFWAPWCGPCRMMAPAFEAAAQQLEPQVRLAKVNTEAEPVLASRFHIRSIPTLAVFWRGQELARQAGAMGQADLVRWVRTVLAGTPR